MRRLLPLVFALTAVSVFGQQFTRQTPNPRDAENHYRAESYFNTSDGGGRWQVELSIRSAADVEISRVSFSGPDAQHPGATAVAFNDALVTAIGGETGGNVRRVRARIINFLNVHGYLPAGTVVP